MNDIKLQVRLHDIKLAHLWCMLSCVGFSTQHYIGATVSLIVGLWLFI